jgi:putative glutamine amidotransferase
LIYFGLCFEVLKIVNKTILTTFFVLQVKTLISANYFTENENTTEMKTFLKLISLLALLLILNTGTAQNFLESGIKPGKHYVLLAHPTVQNLKTIQFLLDKNILQLPNVEFIGVYSDVENYDYGQSIDWIKNPEMNRFHLQEITGKEDTTQIYRKNDWTIQFKNLFDHSDGIFFFGGPDIQPSAYHQKNLYSEVTDPNRHLFELSFLFHLLGGYQDQQFAPFLKEKPEYFVTGFCLGLQSMNVATGGSLTQDIPAQTYKSKSPEETRKLKKDQLHRNYWKESDSDTLMMRISFHHIQYTADPFFTERVKVKKIPTPLVLSSHHQSISDLGMNLIVTATSMDGQVIEGIHHRIYHNVFAVQFHPEVPDLYQEGKKLKYMPGDVPKSYFEILSEQDRAFHLKYWQTISKAIKSSITAEK